MSILDIQSNRNSGYFIFPIPKKHLKEHTVIHLCDIGPLNMELLHFSHVQDALIEYVHLSNLNMKLALFKKLL